MAISFLPAQTHNRAREMETNKKELGKRRGEMRR